MRIAMIGTGWLGEKLAQFLVAKNQHVIATTTSPEKIIALGDIATEVHLLDFTKNPDFSVLANVDVAIFSMPIAKHDWYAGFQKLNQEFTKTLLFSSTGIYPQEKKTFTEDDEDNLRTDLLTSEETVQKKYPQTIILRLAGLMGDERTIQNIYKNRAPEHPNKRVNLIHYQDILEMVWLLIQSEQRSRIYNIVAPEHPTVAEILNTNETSGETLAEADQRIISSQRFIQDFNYKFIHPNPKNFPTQ